MELLVKSRFLGSEYTISRLYIDGEKICDVLEDTVRDLKADGSGKIAGKTAIPAGKYKVILSYSPSFKRILPELLDVPFFQYIRIHNGLNNKNTKGCLLPGENRKRGQVINSPYYEKKIIEMLTEAEARGEENHITIER